MEKEDRDLKLKSAPFTASVKLLRYQFVAYKLYRVIGMYSGENFSAAERHTTA